MEPVGIVLATQISALDEEARRIEAAPLPLAEALTRLEEQRRTVAARITARRAERVRGFFSPKGVTHLDDLYGLAQGFGRQGRELEDAIREALDARFLADVAEWQKAIKAATIPGDPMPVAERAPRLAQLARDRVELERQEERLVMRAERDGLQLDRRETADPAVVVTTVFATDAAA